MVHGLALGTDYSTQANLFSSLIMSYQFADILAPDLSSSGLFRHEGDAVQLREEIVQTLHTGTKRQVGTVQTGLYVVPAVTNQNISMKEGDVTFSTVIQQST